MRANRLFRIIVLVALATAGSLPALAENVEKKFRLGGTLGFFNTTDDIQSDAANVLVLENREQEVVEIFIDPRNDSAVFGKFDVQSGPIATVHAQYAVNKIFIVEASVGYFKGDLGDVELSAQFDNVEVPETEPFNFSTYRLPAGEVERVPIQLSALARFRPRASFNPYVGGGIGYSFIGFETSDELNALSQRMDASIGAFAEVTGALFGDPRLITTGSPVDLEGATVEVEDTFEWHVAGGAEYSFKRNWAVYVDVRWSFASRSIELGFNNGQSLGVPVPQLTDFIDSEAGLTARAGGYGAVNIRFGGLIDAGTNHVVPRDGAPAGTNCMWNPGDPVPDVLPANCTLLFVFEPDGELDPGFHYVQGGKVDLDGFAAAAGVRYTF